MNQSDQHPIDRGPKVALVTGGGQRIGAVLSERLAQAGYAVLIHYRNNAEGADTVRTRIRDAGGQAAIVQADLCNRDERATLIARASDPFGPLTLLVNNASTFEPDRVIDLDEALWDAHFGVHAEAPIFLARDFAHQLPAGATGNIVNIIDERVLNPAPAYFSYALSKSTLNAATTVLAQSLAPQIRVNAIGPGPVLPHAGQSQEAFDTGVKRLLLQHHADPDAIADALLYILSASAMTGQMLTLDGGRHLDYPPRRGPTPRR